MGFMKFALCMCGLLFLVIGVVHAEIDASRPGCDFQDCRVDEAPGVLRQTPPLINAFAAPDSAMRDLAYDGEFLWAANSGDGNSAFGPRIYKLDADSGTVIDSFPGVSGNPCGLAWDGQYLWHSVYLSGTIYQLDPTTMIINASFPA
ncbi:hypothetical protein KAS45_06755, partial [candidate division WOR-3 bacterium]|nr:hypothetical protein [candidate division WOR-3 bacterium]